MKKYETWFVYILYCGDGTFYTGITKDLSQRLSAHKSGVAAKYTRIRRPIKIVWHEKHSDINSARQREIQIKNWRREKKLRLINT